MSPFIKVYHSYTTKDLAAVYKPSGNFQPWPFFSFWRFFKKMLLMTSESTGIHWSVWGCVLLYTSCGSAFGMSSPIAVSAVITLFNFNRLGYSTHSQTFQLHLMKIHTNTHSGLNIPLALVLPYLLFLILLRRNLSTPDIHEMPYMLRIISHHCKISSLLVLSVCFISSVCHPLERVAKHLVLEGLSASFYVM